MSLCPHGTGRVVLCLSFPTLVVLNREAEGTQDTSQGHRRDGTGALHATLMTRMSDTDDTRVRHGWHTHSFPSAAVVLMGLVRCPPGSADPLRAGNPRPSCGLGAATPAGTPARPRAGAGWGPDTGSESAAESPQPLPAPAASRKTSGTSPGHRRGSGTPARRHVTPCLLACTAPAKAPKGAPLPLPAPREHHLGVPPFPPRSGTPQPGPGAPWALGSREMGANVSPRAPQRGWGPGTLHAVTPLGTSPERLKALENGKIPDSGHSGGSRLAPVHPMFPTVSPAPHWASGLLLHPTPSTPQR